MNVSPQTAFLKTVFSSPRALVAAANYFEFTNTARWAQGLYSSYEVMTKGAILFGTGAIAANNASELDADPSFCNSFARYSLAVTAIGAIRSYQMSSGFSTALKAESQALESDGNVPSVALPVICVLGCLFTAVNPQLSKQNIVKAVSPLVLVAACLLI